MFGRTLHNLIHSQGTHLSLIRGAASLVASILLLPLLLVLFLLKPFRTITFVKIRDDRIGHLAVNTELFFRRISLGEIPTKRRTFIGFASKNPVNQSLLDLYKRKMHIIQVPRPLARYVLPLFFYKTSIAILSKAFINLHYILQSNEFREFNEEKPVLTFTKREQQEGRLLKKTIGIPENAWYVCVHARDAAYEKETYPDASDLGKQQPRDCSIENYLPACNYITQQGGYAIRMGLSVQHALASDNMRIIDYASHYRTAFGDIYFPGTCRFFLCNTSGIVGPALIFNIPLAMANVIPITFPPLKINDLFIPKKIWSYEKKRYLTFREILNSDIINYRYYSEYQHAHLKIHENMPEDILDLAKEMHERLRGTWKTTIADEKLQEKYRSLFKDHPVCAGFVSRIGTSFLRNNRALLE